MDNGVKVNFNPISKNNTGSPKSNLRSDYSLMTEAIRSSSQFTSSYADVIRQSITQYAENKGELVIVANGNKPRYEHEGKAFTNFGVIPLSVIRVHFLNRIRHDLELFIWGQNLSPKIIRLEANKLGSSRWLDDLGPMYICEKWGIENLKILIQAMSQYAPAQNEYEYPGWKIDGENIYIMTGHPLYGKDWDKEKATSPCIHSLRMLDVASHSLTIPLMAIALLSLVQSRMIALGDYFKGVCCIVAPTQSFKTTLVTQFFDFDNGWEADTNFEATVAAIERTIGSVRDSVSIVDDYKPGATKAEENEMVRKISTVIRMCSDNSGGIQKAGTQNSTISNAAHGMVVVTAEHMQLTVQSTMARLLILELNRKSVDTEKLTYFQNNHNVYQDFIKGFIQYIASLGVDKYCQNLLQRFRQDRNILRSELPNKDILVDNRTSDMVTWLWLAFGEFLNYAQAVDAISTEQFDGYSKESRTVFLSVMEQQAERVSALNPVKQFFRGLGMLLDTKEATLGQLQARNNRYSASDSKKAIGFIKRGSVYLKNGVAIQAVVSHFRRYGVEFTVSESALRKALADNGYILPKGKGYIHRLFVNRESYQCIKFEQTQFDALRKGGKQDETGFDEEIPSDRAVRNNADTILGR